MRIRTSIAAAATTQYHDSMTGSQKRELSKKSAAVLALIVSLLYFAAIVTGNSVFLGIMWVILTILLSLLMIAIGIAAGVVVVKSLFVVAAELSLLIFITQSYCSAPGYLRLPSNNAAMGSLFTVAILYIIGFLFAQSLWNALKERYQKIGDRPGTWEKWVTAIAYFLFVGLFVWELYLIMSPIISGLCIYR